MGNEYWGLGIHMIFISIYLVANTYTCLGDGNNITTVSCSKQELFALLKFKNSVEDYYDILSSWVGNDCCHWKGVLCETATGYVQGLHLRGSFLAGLLVGKEVSNTLGELRHLKYLDLSGNDFQGSQIPEFIGSLKQLSYLNLSNSAFSGNIPHHIGNLSNLKVLDLSSNIKNFNIYFLNNKLIAHDMSWISGLSSLEYLDLSNVDLNGAKNRDMVLHIIPSLVKLSLSRCGLSNADLIPLLNSSATLANIKHLDLGFNSFYGHFPHVFLNMTSLQFLDLSSFDLSLAWNSVNLLSMIPSLLELHLANCRLQEMHLSSTHLNISTLSNIQHLDLRHNLFLGRFPSAITNMTSLNALDLSANNLNSSVPVMRNLLELDLSWNSFKQFEQVGIWRQCHLRQLRVSYNRFPMELIDSPLNISDCSKYALEWLYLDGTVSGIIPESLGRMENLIGLDLSRSQLIGQIPKVLGSLRILQELDLSENDLIGSIPNFSGKLTKLYLFHNHLNGLIPESLGRLRSLEELDLSRNQLKGPVPILLGKLTRIDLSYNQLSGLIPQSLGRLRSLEVLYLSQNQLKGPIPTFLGKLAILDLSYNYLNGSIPQSLGRLRSLVVLDLSQNQLKGSIPKSVGRLVSLQVFSMSSNSLSGTIPASMGKLTKLQRLDVSNNFLEGVVSEAHLAKLSMLESLKLGPNSKLIFNVSQEWMPPFQLIVVDLSSCKIGDAFPWWLRSQINLYSLVLSNTTISGPLPTWLVELSMIGYLDLSHNKLSGPLIISNEMISTLLLQNNLFNEFVPRLLCTCTDLRVLDLSQNKFIGKIPDCLGNLRRLSIMKLSSNRLSSVIPSSLHNISSLNVLSLNDNNFNGEVPGELGNLYALVILDLGNNEFSGNLPNWIGEKLASLVVLRLHKNNFTGEIPRSLCQMSKLQILDVAQNNISGLIPHCLGNLESMVMGNVSSLQYGAPSPPSAYKQVDTVTQVMKGVVLEYTKTLAFVINMDLSSNKLIGEIPVEITTLRGLVGLNLSNNHLSGDIPINIGNMKALISLDFSRNKLSGNIPPSMAALNFLSHLNLSHNDLSGQIPTGNQMQTFNDPSIYVGNKDLCGPPLPRNCSNQEDQTIPKKTNYKIANGSRKAWLYWLDVMSGFATGFWGVIGVLSLKKQWRHKLFMFVERTTDKIYVAVMVRVARIRRGTNAI